MKLQEEWVTRKKVEVVTKRQIATRVQREVLLEDGKVVQDTGPKVTTTTTEDTQKNESENTEHHDLGDGSTENWVASGDPGVVTEIREKKVTTREQTNETLETEDIKHHGDISDEVSEVGSLLSLEGSTTVVKNRQMDTIRDKLDK
ncbi:hypothetical protein GE061_001923 [Apolygus lucorum]|uniref:Uncharacterized protein n=1 Tax=Apolygus lucorum TaxID=248454 RepID=A0A8S9X5I3_APOLU|nr:hypothetical protein GE061_001923 [Apolygus lucorum]